MKTLHELANLLEEKIKYHETINTTISSSSVGWHLEHIFLTNRLVIRNLKKSDPRNYSWSFSIPKFLIFTFQKIPRGKAKSPDIVTPRNTITEESLRTNCLKAKEALNELEPIAPNQFFKHPFLGNLKLNETITFLKLHTKHHLAIIDDIIKSK